MCSYVRMKWEMVFIIFRHTCQYPLRSQPKKECTKMRTKSLIGCYAGTVAVAMAAVGCATTVDLGTVESANMPEPAPSEVTGGANSTISGGASSVGAGGAPPDASGGNASAEPGICDPDLFVAGVRAARAASNAPSSCIAPFSPPLAAPVREATSGFLRSVLNVPAASLRAGTQPCGAATGGAVAPCANIFDKWVGQAVGGNLNDILRPYSLHLEGCATDLELTDWQSTVNGITWGSIFCLSGHSAAGRVVGMCLLPQATCL